MRPVDHYQAGEAALTLARSAASVADAGDYRNEDSASAACVWAAVAQADFAAAVAAVAIAGPYRDPLADPHPKERPRRGDPQI